MYVGRKILLNTDDFTCIYMYVCVVSVYVYVRITGHIMYCICKQCFNYMYVNMCVCMNNCAKPYLNECMYVQRRNGCSF